MAKADAKDFKPASRKILISEEGTVKPADGVEKSLAPAAAKPDGTLPGQPKSSVTAKAPDVKVPGKDKAPAPVVAEPPAPPPAEKFGAPPKGAPGETAPKAALDEKDILALRKKYRIPMQNVSHGLGALRWVIGLILLIVIGGLIGLFLTGQL